MQALEKLSGSNKVTLVRTPGRHEIPGKEEADKLVKTGIEPLLAKRLAAPLLWAKKSSRVI
jgi:hypothetical protein